MYGVFPIARPQFGDAINVPGQHTKRYRKQLSIPCTTRTCETSFNDFELYNLQVESTAPTTTQTRIPAFACSTRACQITFPPDIATYNLQDALFFNGTELSFIVECPPGYQCAPGEYPQIVVYPPGTFVFPFTPSPGFPIVMTLKGCQSTVTLTLPATATDAEIAAAAQTIIAEIARQQAECDSIPPSLPPAPGFLNQTVYYAPCYEGQVLTYTGPPLPSWVSLDSVNNRMVGASGYFAGSTQANANSYAQIAINNFSNSAILDGILECVGCEITTASPLPSGEPAVPYSETLSVTGLSGTPEWTIEAGSLPDGLSLDSSTGEISGTPTTEEVSDFTVRVSNGTTFCEKGFSITVASGEFPDFIYTAVSGNAFTLTAATINGYDFLTPGQPPDGTALGSSVVTIWDVIFIGIGGYTIAFRGAATAGAGDVGTYRVTIDNVTVQPFSGFNNNEVTVLLNAVPQYVYNTNTTTGPLFVDVVVGVGDELSVFLAVEGVESPAGSFQITFNAVKL